MSLHTGTQLGHYEITSGLGAGGMGEVYRAHDTRLGRDVAIKLLPENVTHDSSAIDRFMREARAASALNHPNIITIYEVGNIGTRRFIVMELVRGQPLRAMIGEPPSLDLLARIGSQAAKALSVAHRAGIIHRDIKPENIMVRDDGYVKVLDFGLARLAAPAAQSSADTRLLDETKAGALTESGLIVGTVKYMSPEQARGESVSGATDVFSLGIVLYEMATTLHPFSAGSHIGILQAIASEQPVAPSRLNPELSAEFDLLILQMLEKQARHRPAASDVDRVLTEMAHTGSGRSISGARTKLTARHSVGREKELEQAREAFESVSGGRGLMLAVAGEPGIGKTTFVEDFIAELESSRTTFIVARGRCSERLAGAEAYLPLLEALDNSLRGEGSQWSARVMKQLAPTWFAQVFTSLLEGASTERVVRQLSQERMKREFGALLEEVSRLRPLILFIDDLHWADVSTTDMLGYLASKFDSMRVLIVVTYRPSDLLLVKHPFLQIKPEMIAHGTCREIRLEFLSRAEIELYLALEFPSNRLPAELAALIHARTEGNPLFMSDLVRYLRDRTVIAKDNGHWILARSLAEVEQEMPESVRGMIQRKIDQLSEDERHLLVAASVQGCDFDSAVIARALRLESADVEERLEEIERVHALMKFVAEYEFPDRTLTLRYRFVHALYQNALYSSLRPSRRGSLSRSVAQALMGYYKDRSNEVAAELAHLFEAARDFFQAVEYYLAAAQNTAQVFAHTETQVLARRGLELLKLLPESGERDGKELALQLALGGALSLTRGFATAEAGSSHARARELCEKMGDIPQLAPALFGLFVYYVVAGELETARQVADQLLRVAQSAAEQTMLMVGYHALGTVRLFLGDIDTSYEYLERALSFYDPEHHLTYVLRYRYDPSIDAMCHMSLILWLRGYRDQALRKIGETLSLAERANDPHSIAFAQTIMTSIFERGGEVQPAKEWAERCIQHCDKHEIVENKLWVTCAVGWALARLGQSGEGIALIKGCIEVLRAQRAEIAFPHLLVILADALREAGRIEEGLDAIAEAFEVIERTGERVCESEVHIMKGRLLTMRGGNEDLSEAEECFREAIELARRQRAKVFELRATTNLSRLYEKSGRREEARRMLEEIYGWFSEGLDAPDQNEARALLDTLRDERGAS